MSAHKCANREALASFQALLLCVETAKKSFERDLRHAKLCVTGTDKISVLHAYQKEKVLDCPEQVSGISFVRSLVVLRVPATQRSERTC